MKAKRALAAFLFVLLSTVACTVPAHSIGIFGQWQDSNDGDSGYGLGIKQNFGIIPLISVEARASWLRYGGDDESGNLDMFPLEAFGRLNLGMFYGGVGIGYYLFSGDYSPKNTVGGFAAAGIEISLLGLGVFGELRYLVLEPDLDTDIGGSVDMSGMGANIGVTLPF